MSTIERLAKMAKETSPEGKPMASIYLSNAEALDAHREWIRNAESRPATADSLYSWEFIAMKAAEHAARVCAEICNDNGRSDGHTCAEELLSLIGGSAACYPRFCYVRFGHKDGALPDNEQSRNALTGQLERGVSVYEAVERDGKYQILLPRLEGTAPATLGMCFNSAQGLWGMENYPLYEVSGELVGYGSDGEPLLKNCSVVRRIFEQGKGGGEAMTTYTPEQYALAARLDTRVEQDPDLPTYYRVPSEEPGEWREWHPTADTEAGWSDALVLLAAVLHYCENEPLSEEICDAHSDLCNALGSGKAPQIQAATMAAAVAIGQHMEQSNGN